MKLKKGDRILITAGKDKNRKGKIEKIFSKKKMVLVPRLNIYKKHVRPKSKEESGGIVEIARPLPIANVALICPRCKKATRVGYSFNKKGQKKRFCKKCQKIID